MQGQPSRRHSGADHERSVAGVVGDGVEDRAHEVGRDPCVRHVADESRFPVFRPHHFGPFVPRRRAAVAQKSIDELEGAVAIAEADEGADDAHLVWRVVLAWLCEMLEVEVVRFSKYHRRKERCEVQRRDRDRRGRRIEVAELRGGGNVIDAMLFHRSLHRRSEGVAKVGRLRRELALTRVERQRTRQHRSVFDSFEAEDVVPVRMDWLRRVALVTDRLGHQTLELAVIAASKTVDVVRGVVDVRPEPPHEIDVMADAVDLGDEEDEFAVAIVLGHRIGAAFVNAAGNLPVRILKACDPFGERFGRIGVTELEQHRAHECTVADPGTVIGSRAGFQRRTVAMNQHVGDAAANRVGDLRRTPDFDGDAMQAFAPDCGDFLERLALRAGAQRNIHFGLASPRATLDICEGRAVILRDTAFGVEELRGGVDLK